MVSHELRCLVGSRNEDCFPSQPPPYGEEPIEIWFGTILPELQYKALPAIPREHARRGTIGIDSVERYAQSAERSHDGEGSELAVHDQNRRAAVDTPHLGPALSVCQELSL
jgi:hypothetical protein